MIENYQVQSNHKFHEAIEFRCELALFLGEKLLFISDGLSFRFYCLEVVVEEEVVVVDEPLPRRAFVHLVPYE